MTPIGTSNIRRLTSLPLPIKAGLPPKLVQISLRWIPPNHKSHLDIRSSIPSSLATSQSITKAEWSVLIPSPRLSLLVAALAG